MFQPSSGLHCYFYSPDFLSDQVLAWVKAHYYSRNILPINIVEIFSIKGLTTTEA